MSTKTLSEEVLNCFIYCDPQHYEVSASTIGLTLWVSEIKIPRFGNGKTLRRNFVEYNKDGSSVWATYIQPYTNIELLVVKR